jgi:hypothetical protein
MMLRSLDELDEVLNRAYPIDCSVPPTLTATWNCVSYAIEVPALDLKVLNRHTYAEARLQAIIDDLPDLLAGAWDDSAWSFSVDPSNLLAAAADTDC